MAAEAAVRTTGGSRADARGKERRDEGRNPRSWWSGRPGLIVRFLLALAVAIGIAVALANGYVWWMSNGVGDGVTLDADTTPRIVAIRIAVLTPLPLLVCSWFALGWSRVNRWIHRWRWALGGLVVAFCTALSLSGSSLNGWHWHLQSGSMLNMTVLGYPRLSRNDEFGINTAFAASQQYNGYGATNSLLGGADPTDMFIVKDAPMFGVGEIFRPFHWGYLLIGTNHGLGFYWSARLVVLFLVGYEFFRLLTRRVEENGEVTERRGLAVLGTSLIAFSTLVQYWFAVNNIVEILVAVFGSIVCFDRYLSANKPTMRNSWTRFGWALLIAECAGMFLWSLYPAWMVPAGYILVALIIWQLAAHWGDVHMRTADWLFLVLAVAIFAALTLLTIKGSAAAIHDELNTSYPGQRAETGGFAVSPTTLLGSAGAQFLTARFVGVPEAGHIPAFVPLGFLVAVANMFGNRRGHRTDPLMVILIFECALFAEYMIVGMPVGLAKATMLSQCLTPRVCLGFELANVILLIRGIAMRQWGASATTSVIVSAVLAAYGAHFSERFTSEQAVTLEGGAVYVVPVILFVEYFVLAMLCMYRGAVWSDFEARMRDAHERMVSSRRRERIVWRGNRVCHALCTGGVAFVTLVTIVTGMLVNPVQRGTSALHDDQVLLASQAADSEEPGLFVALGDRSSTSSMLANLLAANGLHVLNSTQVTPHWNLWKRIDPEGRHEDGYNRYAYVNIVTAAEVSDDTRFQLPYVDLLIVTMTPAELHDLGVTYATSDSDLSGIRADGWGYKKISEDGAFDLYRIVPVEELAQ